MITAALAFATGCASLSPSVADGEKPGETIVGKVAGISDGDSFKIVTVSNRTMKVRLHGIDAPELAQPFGRQAKSALASKILGLQVAVKVVETDEHGRIVGDVYLGGRWMNLEMVAEGWAWHFKRFSRSEELANAEEKARAKGLGLWKDKHPTPPWEFRDSGYQPRADDREHPEPLMKWQW